MIKRHGFVHTPVSRRPDGQCVAWYTCGREFVAAKLGDAHGAVLEHVRGAVAMEEKIEFFRARLADERRIAEESAAEPWCFYSDGHYGGGR